MDHPVRYTFETFWRVRENPGAVWDVLYDVPSYPHWWPQVREVGELSGETESYDVLVRSALPYNLQFRLSQNVADRSTGILEAGLDGDLAGFSRWTIRPARAGAILRFEEEVVTTKPLFNVVAPVARPLFVANHWWMMRSGEIGLQTFMSGYRFGQQGPLGKHQQVARARAKRAQRAR